MQSVIVVLMNLSRWSLPLYLQNVLKNCFGSRVHQITSVYVFYDSSLLLDDIVKPLV